MSNSNNHNFKKKTNEQIHGNKNPGRILEVGRLTINHPRYSHIDVYLKSNQSRGATVICEKDGGRYGVTHGVLKCFTEIGSYHGWAYLNAVQASVFKFIIGDASNATKPILSIETPKDYVDIPPSKAGTENYADGAFVAFYSRFARWNGKERSRREATDIFSIDGEHLPLIAKLISDGQLIFPDHNEVLQLFFDSLPNIKIHEQQDLRLFNTALTWLATNSEAPVQFQQLARVEQTKIASARMEQVNTSPFQHRNIGTDERKDAKIRSTSATQVPAKTIVIGDVVQVKLQLD